MSLVHFPFLVKRYIRVRMLMSNSEKEELDLQLRAVPEIERRIAELTAA